MQNNCQKRILTSHCFACSSPRANWAHTGRVFLEFHIRNLVNKTYFVHNLFLIYLSICTCFGRLWAHHHEKQRCSCDTCYLLFCVDDCLVCIPDSHPRTRHILRKNCAPIWFYLQDYTEMHGQQNIKLYLNKGRPT